MKRENFVIDMPLPDWTDQTIYAFAGPSPDGRSHRILLKVDAALEHVDIEQYAQSKKKLIMDSLESAEVLKDQQTTLKYGNPVVEYVIKWMMNGKTAVYRKYIFVIFREKGFIFHVDFSRDTYQFLNNEIKKLVEALIPGTFAPPISTEQGSAQYGLR